MYLETEVKTKLTFKEKALAVVKSRVFWAGIGTVAGAIYPPIGQFISLFSNVFLGGGLG